MNIWPLNSTVYFTKKKEQQIHVGLGEVNKSISGIDSVARWHCQRQMKTNGGKWKITMVTSEKPNEKQDRELYTRKALEFNSTDL